MYPSNRRMYNTLLIFVTHIVMICRVEIFAWEGWALESVPSPQEGFGGLSPPN